MTKIKDLNDNELAVLTAIYSVAGNQQDITDYEAVEYMLDDNYSWWTPSEAWGSCNADLSKQQFGGYMRDLEKKGLIVVRYDKDDYGQWMGVINEECHQAVLDWLTEGKTSAELVEIMPTPVASQIVIEDNTRVIGIKVPDIGVFGSARRAQYLQELANEKECAFNQTVYLIACGGIDGGSFHKNLIETIKCADGKNLDRLKLAFPGEVLAVMAGFNDWTEIRSL